LTEIKDGTSTKFRKAGWDDLAAEFKVKDLLETGVTRFDGKAIWYIRLGRPPMHPKNIYNMYKQNPNFTSPPFRLGSRATTKFVTKELVNILNEGALFEKLLGGAYYDDKLLYSKIGNNERLIAQGLESGGALLTGTDGNTSESHDDGDDNIIEDVIDNIPWTLKMGTCAAADEFPILASFGIPSDNPQTIKMLVSELQKLQKKSGILPSGVNTIKSHKSLYVQVPTGPSKASKRRLARVRGYYK
jgi:hypothetical protein